MGFLPMLRVSIVLSLVGVAVSAPIGAEVAGGPPLTALGLDSRKSIEQNLAVLSEPTEMIAGTWAGSVGDFEVTIAGVNPAVLPNVISVSIRPVSLQEAVEERFGFEATDAQQSACPAELLMDDGIGCSAVYYGCDKARGRCGVLVTTYARDDALGYPPYLGYTTVTWSSEGFELPAR